MQMGFGVKVVLAMPFWILGLTTKEEHTPQRFMCSILATQEQKLKRNERFRGSYDGGK